LYFDRSCLVNLGRAGEDDFARFVLFLLVGDLAFVEDLRRPDLLDIILLYSINLFYCISRKSNRTLSL
jgi:hypothetical protein